MTILYPQTVFDANTLATSITNNWTLDGLLALAQNVDKDITQEGVYIFPHQNPEGVSKRIAILVRSVTTRENVVEHPMFDEVRQTYEIWCHYVLENIDENSWINSESLIQQMQDEVLRIVQLSYNPSTHTGVFFSTDRRWENRDDFSQPQQQMNRVLTISLIRLRSRDVTVPVGYGGILAFDVTNSDGTGLPGTNYIYTEAYRVEVDEGYDTVEEVVTGNSTGQGVPVHFTGKFAGFFQCILYPKLADIGTSTNELNQLYRILTTNSTHVVINEIPRVYFLQTTQNLAGTPNTLTDAVVIKITRLFRTYDQEDIVKYRLQGKVFKPSTITFA